MSAEGEETYDIFQQGREHLRKGMAAQASVMVPGHGPGTRAKCFALFATKTTPAEEGRLDVPAHRMVDVPGPRGYLGRR